MEISPYLLIPVAAVIINHIARFAHLSWRDKKPSIGELISLPSSDSVLLSFAAALLGVSVAVGGITSHLVAFAILLFLMVLRSNSLSSGERQSHMLLSVLAAYLFSVSYWRDSVAEWFEIPVTSEANRWLIAFGAAATLGALITLRMRSRHMRKLPTARTVVRTIRISLIFPAILGLGVAFLQAETNNRLFTQLIYNYVLATWIILGTIWAYRSVYRYARMRLDEEREHFMKQQKKAKRKKKPSKRAKRSKK